MSYAPKPPVPTLTPSEGALAKMLAAYDAWEAPTAPPHTTVKTLHAIGGCLFHAGYVEHDGALTAAADGLLDKARRAGVL